MGKYNTNQRSVFSSGAVSALTAKEQSNEETRMQKVVIKVRLHRPIDEEEKEELFNIFSDAVKNSIDSTVKIDNTKKFGHVGWVPKSEIDDLNIYTTTLAVPIVLKKKKIKLKDTPQIDTDLGYAVDNNGSIIEHGYMSGEINDYNIDIDKFADYLSSFDISNKMDLNSLTIMPLDLLSEL